MNDPYRPPAKLPQAGAEQDHRTAEVAAVPCEQPEIVLGPSLPCALAPRRNPAAARRCHSADVSHRPAARARFPGRHMRRSLSASARSSRSSAQRGWADQPAGGQLPGRHPPGSSPARPATRRGSGPSAATRSAPRAGRWTPRTRPPGRRSGRRAGRHRHRAEPAWRRVFGSHHAESAAQGPPRPGMLAAWMRAARHLRGRVQLNGGRGWSRRVRGSFLC